MTRPAYRWPDPDRDYANGAFIPGAADYPDRWAREALAFRESLGRRAELDLPYGPAPRENLVAGGFPHHARTLAGVLEALDQGLDLAVALFLQTERAGQGVRHRRGQAAPGHGARVI